MLVAVGVAVLGPMQIAAHASGGTTTGADLQLSGSASTGSPAAGAAFTYTFQVKNSGPQTATSATFTDVLSFGVAISSGSVNGDPTACSTTTDINGLSTLTCSLGDMASGSQLSVVENATAPAATASQGIYDNTPSVQSAATDPNLANNQATVEIKVAAASTAPTLAAGPCATIVAQDPPTLTLASNATTMKATITSCSQLTQANLIVDFEGGGLPDSFVFTCVAPSTILPSTLVLSPGASTTASCRTGGIVNGSVPVLTESGTGTATLYQDCTSVGWPGPVCSTTLGSSTYQWSVNVPPPPLTPPRLVGGRG